jgi:phosphoserine aminotransferase
MKNLNLKKPKNPRFSCGPTKKPDGWSFKKINKKYLGRYHRSSEIKIFIEQQLLRIKKNLKIPKSYKIFLVPGSCTGAMEAVIWNLFGKTEITSIVYDYWGVEWLKDLKKLNLKVDARVSLNGTLPSLEDIPSKNDLFFVWTGTTTGISINNLNFLNEKRKGIVVSDITSAAFIYDIPWKKIDVSVFSWQKALGSESQHGVIVMSPKALDSVVFRPVPKIFDFLKSNLIINTPSLLTISDLAQCLDIYEKNGGLANSFKVCKKNKSIIDRWAENNDYVINFIKNKNNQAISPVYLVFKQKIKHEKLFKYLSDNEIAYDIKNYRLAKPGIRIWTGPTIKKNDLIALTNWLDWCFNKFK